ncbi:secondary thiamine-phosphate synthase enzyme YjbQ [Oceanobacter sp. 3_MG-2023]|uniref:secondary thiamine-phosphate synthase enzyme YjbQ n=1 Tax=Oceanobacter sp. 3_MG-2023 TaxID=3062622 RepID=UPI0027370134|nr:secondary thiamine-phosphate synthase enzyme YjbQ [Oceanobacter sp. 3_MG-2023]MDP2505691.1 secondary thiamine-phosphate synthase enzyme YjbQ [Oceanobacter sp. 3_MG-2023]
MWLQKEIRLSPRSRGFHLITEEIRQQLPELASIDIGLLQLFIQHTSASLTINENADPTVRQDMEAWFHRNVREDESYYRHTLEGSDDLPAHIKASLLGHSVTIPITGGELNMGIWQGIYLGEHRHQGGSRRVLATLQGQGQGQ